MDEHRLGLYCIIGGFEGSYPRLQDRRYCIDADLSFSTIHRVEVERMKSQVEHRDVFRALLSHEPYSK